MKQIKTFVQMLDKAGFLAITNEINEFLVEHSIAELLHFGTVDRHGFAIWYAVIKYEVDAPVID